MADKSLARQVFPPGLVGDLLYKASQMMPMNAFAGRMQPQPMQGQMPQQTGNQIYNPNAGNLAQAPPAGVPMGMPQAGQSHMMPPTVQMGQMQHMMPPNMGGPRLMPPGMSQPGMQPQMQPQMMPVNAFARQARY